MTKVFQKFVLMISYCALLPLAGAEKPAELKSAVLRFYDTYDKTSSVLYWKDPDLFRLEAVGKSGSDVVVLNGEKSWLTSKDGFRHPSRAERDAMSRRLALLAFRFDFSKDKGFYKDLGTMMFGGEKCRRLRGQFDLIMIVSEAEKRPRKITFPLAGKEKNSADTVFFDWEDFGMVKLPRLTFASAEGETTKRILLSAEFNVPVPDSLFSMPELFRGKEAAPAKDGFTELLTRPHAALEKGSKKASSHARNILVPGGRSLPAPRLAAVRPGELIFATDRRTVRIPADRLTKAEQKQYNCTPERARKETERLKQQLADYEKQAKKIRQSTEKSRLQDMTFPDEGDVLEQAQLVRFLKEDIAKASGRIKTLESTLMKDGIIPFVPGLHEEFLILFFTGVNTYSVPKSLKGTGMPLLIPVQRTKEEIASDSLASERENLDRLKVQCERETRFLESMRHFQYEQKLAEKILKDKKKAEQEKKRLADKNKRKKDRDARRKAAEEIRNPKPKAEPESAVKPKAKSPEKKGSLWNPLNWF